MIYKSYQFIVINLLFPIIDIVAKTTFYKKYKLLKKFDTFSRQELDKFQLKKLRETLLYAYKNVPYYTELFDNLKISDKLDKFKINDLHQIPALTKDIIRENFDKLVSKQINTITYRTNKTGGTTGQPLKYYQDYQAYSFSWPANIRGWQKIGYTIGEKIMILGSSSLFKKKKTLNQKILHKLLRIKTFGGINMSPETCEQYLKYIKENNIKYVYGYASSLYTLAKYAFEKKVNISLKGMMPTSEICPDTYKDMYKKAFNCKISDSYGARDGNIAAFTCSKNKFHLSEYSVAIIENQKKIGPVLVTDLYNRSMPFINYKLGDVLSISDEICTCGCNQYILPVLIGRQNHLMEFGNGRIVTGPGWTILFRSKNVAKYRINKIDDFTLKIQLVPDDNYNKEVEENLIRKSLEKEIGKEIKIIIEYKKDFENKINGKTTYFMN